MCLSPVTLPPTGHCDGDGWDMAWPPEQLPEDQAFNGGVWAAVWAWGCWLSEAWQPVNVDLEVNSPLSHTYSPEATVPH